MNLVKQWSFFVILTLPFEAQARGGGFGGIIVIGLTLIAAYIIMYLCFAGLQGYMNMIARLFNVSHETANSGWFPYVCIYGTGFVLLFALMLFKPL